MGNRGRKGIAELAIAPVLSPMRMLQPPADLSASEAALFREVVANTASSHFAASDAPLLASYCQATLLARSAGKRMVRDPDLVATWEKAVKAQAMLATKLRLTVQSRADAQTTARRAANHSPSAYDMPWAPGLGEAHDDN